MIAVKELTAADGAWCGTRREHYRAECRWEYRWWGGIAHIDQTQVEEGCTQECADALEVMTCCFQRMETEPGVMLFEQLTAEDDEVLAARAADPNAFQLSMFDELRDMKMACGSFGGSFSCAGKIPEAPPLWK